MRIFIGYDSRQPIASQVLAHSIWRRASKPVSITRLDISQLPINRVGLTEFTFTRYLVPYLCGYKGQALFLDADMLCLDDIWKLNKHINTQGSHAVSVVQSIERFEWPSLMYFRNKKCRQLTPKFIETDKPMTLEWAESIGNIPRDWNHVVPYCGTNENAKIVHFTQGIPCFRETRDSEYAEAWQDELDSATSTVTWEAIMGNSVHKQRMTP